ncbi:MAG: hypothetical protein LPK36_02660 [Actinomycetes bacterium]|nr:hypothetical protein [Actinomycetes bacterium]
MSDAPEHPNADSERDVPEDLDRVAVPAHVRRSPRFGRFLGTGVGAGLVAAAVLAIALPNSTGVGRFLVFVLLALGLCLAGALVAGALATGLDRASSPRTEGSR